MRVATIVLHYIVDQLTYEAVTGVLAQTISHDVIVIDAGSPSPYVDDRVSVYRKAALGGLAGSVNWAMQILHDYDYVWNYTNDVTAPPEVLGALLGLMAEDSNLAAVQPSMPSWHKHLNLGMGPGWSHVPYIEWAAPLISMDAWKDIGPLDPNFEMVNMDMDWCYRARMKGYRLVVNRDVCCGHPWRGTHDVLDYDIVAQAQRENAYGAKKYGRPDWKEYITRCA